jgi:hydrocephalus-inducing protein
MASQNSSSNMASLINSNMFFVEEKIFYFGTLVPSK